MDVLDLISLRLPTAMLNKIKIKAEQNDQRFSDYIRHLIELGLRIDDMQNDAPHPEKKLEALMYKATFETMMLNRFLVRSLSNFSKEDIEEHITKAKALAANYVKENLGEDCLPVGPSWI